MDENVLDQFFALRLSVMQDLLDMISELRQVIRDTDDLQTKVKLISEINILYTNVSKNSDSLEKYIPEPLVGNKFLDYSKKKSRAQIWKDYVAYCEISNQEPLNKGTFFAHLKNNLGFKEGRTRGEYTLSPPGLRSFVP